MASKSSSRNNSSRSSSSTRTSSRRNSTREVAQIETTQATVDNIVVSRINSLLNRRVSGRWEGTMTELSQALTTSARQRQPEVFPRSASALRKVIDRNLVDLRRAGIQAQFFREAGSNSRRIVELQIA